MIKSVRLRLCLFIIIIYCHEDNFKFTIDIRNLQNTSRWLLPTCTWNITCIIQNESETADKGLINDLECRVQKQRFRRVLRKKCFENLQQIFRRIPMSKCDFNKLTTDFNFNQQISIVIGRNNLFFRSSLRNFLRFMITST